MDIKVLGVMTGTSCDGLDAVCMGISPIGWDVYWKSSAPYPKELRERVLSLQKPQSKHSIEQIQSIHRDLGKWYGSTLKKMINKHEIKPDLIANHGQTVAHFPNQKGNGMTVQLGDSAHLAAITGITVASNFREGDIAAGGQGAPLVPVFHQVLAQSVTEESHSIAVHNIGGISNLTYLGPKDTVLAFDTGPGNIWIDAAAEKATKGKWKMDLSGELSAQGEADEKAVTQILKHPYFSKAIPKSTGRDEFPIELFFKSTKARGPDLVATAVKVTVESIARSYEKYIIKKGPPLGKIVICGGGVKNLTLMKQLQERLPSVLIMDMKELGVDPQYIEAQAFGLLGFFTLLGKPVGGSWTGVKSFGPPGHLIPGENWKVVLSKTKAFLK